MLRIAIVRGSFGGSIGFKVGPLGLLVASLYGGGFPDGGFDSKVLSRGRFIVEQGEAAGLRFLLGNA